MNAREVDQTKTLLKQVASYGFVDDGLLRDAIDTTGLRIAQSNQRLALLGDAILKHVILDDWYPTGTPKGHSNRTWNDDTATATSSSPQSGATTTSAAAALRIGLDASIIVHPGFRGHLSNGMLSTAVEAILGAVYLDSGKDMAVMRTVMASFGLTASHAG